MNIYEFMDRNPWLTFFIVMFVGQYFCVVTCRFVNRIVRHLNIRSQGWPPAHCDADGDFKNQGESEL